MHRREILGLLTGGAAGFYSLCAWAGDTASKGSRTRTGFPDLKRLGSERQVQSIVYSSGAYRVTTADGGSMDFLEADLRFKIDSSDAGPLSATPVILPAGDAGDRAWVVFAASGEIGRFIEHKWT